MDKRYRMFLPLGILAIGILITLWVINIQLPEIPHSYQQFNAQRAWQDLQTQMDFGPRTPGSEAHKQTVEYIQQELQDAGWQVEVVKSERMGHLIQNIVAKRGEGSPWVIFGAHYDSRLYADQDADPAAQQNPVPGANDGASGVAVLLEMARCIPADPGKQVWLVFFDAEDQGRIEGWDWILGSQEFAEKLEGTPDAVVVVDMIGDQDLNVYREKNSDQTLTDEIWATAAELGYGDQIINEEKYSILDDHLPFLEKGIPAVDLIDFDYPYWHTTADVTDKVSKESLSIIGNTLLNWLSTPSEQE